MNGGMGLADRDYMKRTPQELRTFSSRSNVSSDGMLWIVVAAVVMFALPQLLNWLGVGSFWFLP